MEGYRTPERQEFRIQPAKVPPPPPRKKAVAAAKKREAPANGYFQLPDDLEVYFLVVPRVDAGGDLSGG
ncbi:Cyclin-dependent protein kinase inhibitor SMR4, partial [Cucurbita argyrosperma subsp. sororia]